MKTGSVSTDLIGAIIAPKYPDQVGSLHGTWPIDRPSPDGEHSAIVRAVWTDKEKNLVCLAVAPDGTAFETYVSNVLVLPTARVK